MEKSYRWTFVTKNKSMTAKVYAATMAEAAQKALSILSIPDGQTLVLIEVEEV